jgi:FIMAH domain
VRAGVGIGVLLGLTLSALLMLMATAPSQAQTEGVCEDQFNALRTHLDPNNPPNNTEAVPITGGKSDKERAGLLKLVNDAEALASIGKTSDAVKKLSDFTVKVDQLEAAGRISAESADRLRSDAEATISCLHASTASN